MFTTSLRTWLWLIVFGNVSAMVLKCCTTQNQSTSAFNVYTNHNCKLKYRLIYGQDPQVKKVIINDAMGLKNERTLTNHDKFMQRTLGLVLRGNQTLVIWKLSDNGRFYAAKCDFEEEEIGAFNDPIVEMTVMWQLNTAFILTENFNSYGVHEVNLIDKDHRELQIINKLENKIENGSLQVAAYFTTGHLVVKVGKTIFFSDLANVERSGKERMSIDEMAFLSAYKICTTNETLRQSVLLNDRIELNQLDTGFPYAYISINNSLLKCFPIEGSCKCLAIQAPSQMIHQNSCNITVRNDNGDVNLISKSRINSGLSRETESCFRICPRSRLEVVMTNKTIASLYSKHDLPCRNDELFEGQIGSYYISKQFDIKLGLILNSGYLANCAQYMLNKSNYQYIILKKKIYDAYELFSDETDTAYDEKQTQLSNHMGLNLKTDSNYILKIMVQTAFDAPVTVGNLFVDLSKSENEAHGLLSDPYIYDDPLLLKASIDRFTVSFIMPKANSLNDYSYVIVDAATNETKHVFLNETDGVLKNILNGPLEDNVLTGAHHVIFDVTNLTENNFYKLKLLGSSSQTVHSLSDLINFRTLDRPKVILTSNKTNSLSVAIETECAYYVNKKSDQSAGSSSHGNICSMLIIKWKQFGADSWSYITEEIDFYDVDENNKFSDQVNATIENQYYLNYTFVILNLLSNMSYNIEVELKYYYDIQPYVKTLNGKTLVAKLVLDPTIVSNTSSLNNTKNQIALSATGSLIFAILSVCLAYAVYKCYYNFAKRGNIYKSDEILGRLVENKLYFTHNLRALSDQNQLVQIDRAKISRFEKIGTGTFGNVYRGELLDENMPLCVAIKVLKLCKTNEEKNDLFKEANSMSLLNHENLLRFYGVCMHDADVIYIVFEYMNQGDLLGYLRKCRGPCAINYKTALEICLDIAKGCVFLEKLKIVHRDIAARNCLVNKIQKGIVVKIGDFGLARQLNSSDYYKHKRKQPLPIRWMSPESLIDNLFSTQSDIWSYGIVLWEIMTLGHQPYPGLDNQQVIEFVKNGGKPHVPPKCSIGVRDLMYRCWNLKPVDRSSFSHILIDIENIYNFNNLTDWSQHQNMLPIFDDLYSILTSSSSHVSDEQNSSSTSGYNESKYLSD